jgi:hypothetical protein
MRFRQSYSIGLALGLPVQYYRTNRRLPMIRKIPILTGILAAVSWCHPPGPGALEVRLLTPLTSYSSPIGSAFQAVVIAPYEVDGHVALPTGTIVLGQVYRTSKVGIGLIHERAGMDLDFQEYQLPDGRRFPLRARLRRVENARETVNARGHISGILAAANPQSFLGGMWHRPNITLFERSLYGLTGLSHQIWAYYSMGPYGALAIFSAQMATNRLPEPEIQFPVGVEMKVTVSSLPSDVPSFPAPATPVVDPPLAEWLRSQPFDIKKMNGQPAEDVINVALTGSEEELVDAFAAAGWVEASPRTPRSLSHTYQAYSRQTGYPDAPTSRLTYQGEEPDLIFEKSFNTITKRHHIRLWHATWEGDDIWLGAATHDIGIGFDPAVVKFTHRIDSRIDLERKKVSIDLGFAGCSDPAGYVDRDEAVRHAESGISTDGRIAVLALHACSASPAGTPVEPKSPGILLTRFARRMILEGRQYVLRENPYYWGYRAFRWRKNEGAKTSFVDD